MRRACFADADTPGSIPANALKPQAWLARFEGSQTTLAPPPVNFTTVSIRPIARLLLPNWLSLRLMAKSPIRGKTMRRSRVWALSLVALLPPLVFTIDALVGPVDSHAQAFIPFRGADRLTNLNAQKMVREGREIFRFDTFGDEDCWGGKLRLHEAIKGKALGGVAPGLSAKTALSLGLKVDVDLLPSHVVKALAAGDVDLANPATTIELLKLNSVVGVKGFFDEGGNLQSVGIQCALCHSTVNDSFAPGIGSRLDGWANRDLNVGAIIALAPDLSFYSEALDVSEETVLTVLNSWGPGKFDAQLILDGKAFRPDGQSAATLLPPAFGLAGVNLHTWTGWGSVTYWNAFVANLEMQGKGTFFDPRLDNAEQFPVAARLGLGNIRNATDLITPKLAALHSYQLAIPAPPPPAGSFDPVMAERGKALFSGKADCARCHVPPLYTEPGWNLHTGEEIGIDDFQANRSPDRRYRTAPLKGLWTHTKGGFYHDGRFATLAEVVNHYDQQFNLGLTEAEKKDLIQFLLSL